MLISRSWTWTGWATVRFTIEIYTIADSSEALLYRTTFTALTPLAAHKEASRVNEQDEIVYTIGR
jgi:hypothetical protein